MPLIATGMVLIHAGATPPAEDAVPPLAPILLVAGVVTLGFFLVMSVRNRIARRQASTPSAREQIDRIKARSSESDDMQVAMAQMVDTAQRLAAQLDAKAARLERLLEEADIRMGLLEATEPGAPGAPGAPGPGTVGASDGTGQGGWPDRRTAEGADATAAAGKSVLDPLTASVYELADAGHSHIEIARQLDEQVGKVELILALRETGS